MPNEEMDDSRPDKPEEEAGEATMDIYMHQLITTQIDVILTVKEIESHPAYDLEKIEVMCNALKLIRGYQSLIAEAEGVPLDKRPEELKKKTRSLN